jgi:hypothetical protein
MLAPGLGIGREKEVSPAFLLSRAPGELLPRDTESEVKLDTESVVETSDDGATLDIPKQK